jgi:hypothetical protein
MTSSFFRNLIIVRCATLLATACTAILIAPDGWGGEGPISVDWKFKHVITCQRKHIHTSWFVLKR